METHQMKKQKSQIQYKIIICIIGLLINIGGIMLVSNYNLPLYLDTVGTILAAVLSGGLPGIIVGFITNVIKGVMNPQDLYYGILNMLTAVLAAFFAKRGYFKGFIKPMVFVTTALAAVTGLFSSVLTWYLNGASIGGIGEKYARFFHESSGLSEFAAQFTSDMLIEYADKWISVFVAIFLMALIPKKLKAKFKGNNPLLSLFSDDVNIDDKKMKCRSVSLRTKIVLILIAASVLIAGASTAISYMLYRNATIDEHIRLANGITSLAASAVDANHVDEYIEKGTRAPGYIDTEKMLYKLRESSPDIQFVYVYKIEEDGCHVVFDLDTEEFKGSNPGDVIEFEEAFMPYVPKLLSGETIEPIISKDTYGWLLTVYKPVYDLRGNCKCYAAADISMDLISGYGYSFMVRLISLFASFFILTMGLCVWFVEHNVILPINAMAYCAGSFAYNSDEARHGSVERMRKLNIRTGDEIENLYNAFLKTSQDSIQYVSDIQHQTEMISQMQNGLILVLADMVESRDKCTGDHVRKTAAYTRIIMNEMKKRGYYKEQLTDEFMDNVYNAAPLHDIGKIHIPDMILNKPGKLTDEEFTIMKTHTTVGSEILEQAIEMVPESGYLTEAKNLAEFHHEKWNGRGYPHGLSGENIPLSARIMAVADVFDALVSRRSYKKPFTFEKAMSIIREDAGSHFDPLVAEAFLGGEDEVRKVAEEFDHMNGPKQS